MIEIPITYYYYYYHSTTTITTELTQPISCKV